MNTIPYNQLSYTEQLDRAFEACDMMNRYDDSSWDVSKRYPAQPESDTLYNEDFALQMYHDVMRGRAEWFHEQWANEIAKPVLEYDEESAHCWLAYKWIAIRQVESAHYAMHGDVLKRDNRLTPVYLNR